MSVDLKAYCPVHPKWPDWYQFIEYKLGFEVSTQADGIQQMLTVLRHDGRVDLCDRDMNTFVYVVDRTAGLIVIAHNCDGLDVKVILTTAEQIDALADQMEAAWKSSRAN